jgi:hypothetical protein
MFSFLVRRFPFFPSTEQLFGLTRHAVIYSELNFLSSVTQSYHLLLSVC